MKIAIVHDELVRRGGAERVVLAFHNAFPKAPIYTLVHNPKLTYSEFKDADIHYSWFQRVASDEFSLKKMFFPFGLFAMQGLDMSGFDVILISSTYVAKFINPSKNCLVINYCHTPFRLAWYPEYYRDYSDARFIKKMAYNIVIGILKKIDYKKAQRTDYFIANSKEIKNKISAAYDWTGDIEIINPPVDYKDFYLSDKKKDYFLVVSRLEHYKKVDLVIDVFNTLGFPLMIVGKGSQSIRLKNLARSNITFLEGVSNKELAKLYAKCKALIFPQHEDYGITPLEANASGRPVIAYSKGGVLDTMIPYKGDNKKATALFFHEQNPKALLNAIDEFLMTRFDPIFIRKHAEKFEVSRFIQQIKKFVMSKYEEQKNNKSLNLN